MQSEEGGEKREAGRQAGKRAGRQRGKAKAGNPERKKKKKRQSINPSSPSSLSARINSHHAGIVTSLRPLTPLRRPSLQSIYHLRYLAIIHPSVCHIIYIYIYIIAQECPILRDANAGHYDGSTKLPRLHKLHSSPFQAATI